MGQQLTTSPFRPKKGEESKVYLSILYNVFPVNRYRFNFLQIIGRGGFGRVWKVLDKKTQRIYALKEMKKVKVIDKKSELSILFERELLSRLTHPFIVNMHYSFQDKDNLYLIIDYLSGGDLRYHICIHRFLNETQTKFILACLIIGLEYIHKNKIIHRDIKPENLVLDKNGYVHITDFGVAKVYQEDNYKETSGTPGYMSPEVITGMNHSYSVDFYALGVIGYEFLLGKRPYYGRSRKEIKEQMLSRQARITLDEGSMFNISDEAVNFINHLLIRKPELRLGHNSINDIKEHEWFDGFDWDSVLHKKQLAPFIPEHSDNYDKKYCEGIEKIGLATQERYTIYMKQQKYQTIFRNFTYYKNESILQCNQKRSFIGLSNENNQIRQLIKTKFDINDELNQKHPQTITSNKQRCQSALNFKTLEIPKQHHHKIKSNRNYKDKPISHIKIDEFIYKKPPKNIYTNYELQSKGLEKNVSHKNIFSTPTYSNNTCSNNLQNKEPLFEISTILKRTKKHQQHFPTRNKHNNTSYNKWFYRSLSNSHLKGKSQRLLQTHTNEQLILHHHNSPIKTIKTIDKLTNPLSSKYTKTPLTMRNKQKKIHTGTVDNTSLNQRNTTTSNCYHIRHKSFISQKKNIYINTININNINSKGIIHNKHIPETCVNAVNDINCNSHSAERIENKKISFKQKNNVGNVNINNNKDIFTKVSSPKINELNKYYYYQLFNNFQSPTFHAKKINSGILQNEAPSKVNEHFFTSKLNNAFVVSNGIGYNINLTNNTISTNNTKGKMIKSPVSGVVRKYKKNISTSHTTVSTSGHVQK